MTAVMISFEQLSDEDMWIRDLRCNPSEHAKQTPTEPNVERRDRDLNIVRRQAQATSVSLYWKIEIIGALRRHNVY